jgi:hydroxymethylpyrimidine/phosphomethylpyrimidine kinase
MENERNRAPNCQSTVVRCLTIAGSDSGGGAGIQADLKTFSALNTHGMSVVTAVTAQNTMLVSAVQLIDPSMVQKQIEAVIDDIGVDSIKIGMLGSPDIVRVVARVRNPPVCFCLHICVVILHFNIKVLTGSWS